MRPAVIFIAVLLILASRPAGAGNLGGRTLGAWNCKHRIDQAVGTMEIVQSIATQVGGLVVLARVCRGGRTMTG
ncbi:hypothetical protein EV128_11989 [Rhizobium azibense]|nr:hypothetical protein EV128_11989 [Rhizobium azibense]